MAEILIFFNLEDKAEVKERLSKFPALNTHKKHYLAYTVEQKEIKPALNTFEYLLSGLDNTLITIQ